MSLAKILSPRLCELGKIKIGGLGDERTSQAGGKYRVPVKYDHFVITTLYRGDDGRLRTDDALMSSLAEHADPDGMVRSLPITLLSNEVEDVLQVAYLMYDGKKLAAKSDGETLTKYADLNTRQWLPEPVSLPWKPEWADLKDKKGHPLFKLHCTMNVIIASRVAKWGGFYKFRTTSRITADQLYGSLVQLRQLTGGILRGLPLRLVVRPLQVAPDGKPTVVYVVHVELAGSDVLAIQKQALEIAQYEVRNAKMLAAAQAEYRQLLRAPDEFADDAEEAEVAQEFAPHQQPGQLPPPPAPAQPAPDTFALDGEGDDGPDPTAPTTEPTAPAAESRSPSAPAASPVPAAERRTSSVPLDSPPPDRQPQNFAGGDIVRRIVELLGDKTGLDWTQIRDDRVDADLKPSESGGVAKACGFTPGPALKVGQLLPGQALALYERLQKRADEKAARAEKRKAVPA
jgi:hypothetical protein